MASDEEDFVFFGTPIQREDDGTSRKKKSVAEAAGQLRTLVPWKQEVRDEEGRRRFHGAFTGGFSAGYYNTVGSKEGWTPQTFTSSRKNRASMKEQNIMNFLDDDEKEDLEGRALGTSLQFDTFGFTSAELARKQAAKEQEKRPSAIPGPIPDELVLPASNSIGVKLLLKMGWRHGHSIKDSRTNSLYDARREARKALIAFSSNDPKLPHPHSESNKADDGSATEPFVDVPQSTPVFVLNPKQDMHGLGFDPFKHAPEFRESKRLRVSGSQELGNRRALSTNESRLASKSGKIAPGFGIGALEELDDEDEDVYASGIDFEETHVQEIEEPTRMILEEKQKHVKTERGILPGFKVASNSDYQLERYDPPVIPGGFEPYHKFSVPLETATNFVGTPPSEVPPPEDNSRRVMIEGFAALVSRCGKLFEDISREKNKDNPVFCFLNGGEGHDYYARKLWEEQQKRNDRKMLPVDMKSRPSAPKMTAESRGNILGERPLEKSTNDPSSAAASADTINLKFHLSDTFMKPALISEFPESSKPFKADPEKQLRFERFLKEKYHGGLRVTDSGGSSSMSEADRAREKLDFEAAAEAIQKGEWGKSTELSSTQQFLSASNMQFTSGGLEQGKALQEEQILKDMYPKREEYQWRPSAILCKRFEITDPYLGKPPPLPRVRGRIDSLIFASDFVTPTKSEEVAAAVYRGSLAAAQSEHPVISEEKARTETEFEPGSTNAERPVDLYKAIFSDDSDDERDSITVNKEEDSQKKSEAANATLNRLVAADFLESLGKELGFEVPSQHPLMINKLHTSGPLTEITGTSIDIRIPEKGAVGVANHTEIFQGSAFEGIELNNGNQQVSNDVGVSFVNRTDKSKLEVVSEDKKSTKTHTRQDLMSIPGSSEDERKRGSSKNKKCSSVTSSEDERTGRTHSRRKHRRRSSSDTDSDDRGSRRKSRKDDKRSSSRSGSSKKHSKHRSRTDASPSRSSHRSSGRGHSEDRKRSRKSRDRDRDSVSPRHDTHRKHR